MNFKNLKAPQQFPRVYFPDGSPSLQLRFGKMGINWDGGNTGSGYEPEYQAILDYAIAGGFALPSVANQAEQNQLVIDLKAAGVWDDLDIFYCFLGDGDSSFARINWKDPDKFQVVSAGAGAVYSKLRGYKSNVNGGLNTGFTPLTHATKAVNTDTSMFAGYSATASAGVDEFLSGVVNHTQLRYRGTDSENRINTATSQFVPRPTGAGFLHTGLKTATIKSFLNGVQVMAQGASPTGLAINPLFIGTSNNAGNPFFSFTVGYMEVFGFGASLNGKELGLYNAWNAYKTVVQQDLEYQEILEYADVIGAVHPSATVQSLQKQLINDLKTAGVWDELDSFYCFAGDGDEAFALIDWKRKATAKAVNPKGTNTGAQYVPNVGFTASQNGFVDSHFVPSAGLKYTQNNASYFFDANALTNLGLGCLDIAQNKTNYLDCSFGFIDASVNSASAISRTSTIVFPFSGFIQARRSGATALTTIVNGVAGANYTEASAAPISQSMLVGGTDNAGVKSGYPDMTVACFGAGSALVGKEMQLYNAWTAYKSALPALDEYDLILTVARWIGATPPSASVQTKQRQLITDLKAANVWDKFDIFYNFLTDGDLLFSFLNWVNPTANQLSLRAGTLPVLTPLVGLTGVSPCSMDTKFTPITGTTKYDPSNVAHFAFEQEAASGQYVHGSTTSGLTRWTTVDYNPSNRRIGMDSTGFLITNIVDFLTDEHVIVQRAPQMQYWINGVNKYNTDFNRSSAPYDRSFSIGASLSSVTVSFTNLKFFSAGGYLNGTELLYSNAWTTYKTSL